ncbi:MAG: Gfo/Idh/MocA family oxidoreductase [Oscillospiraceae bacterium]|nr:Gfo/Idh/MocA family oxidoreductase [Oscillospiraceae bacterium]
MVRVAILGAGGMGRIHSGNLSSMDGVEVVAVCDVSAAAAESLAGRLGCAAYASMDEMLGEARLDAAYICIPPYAHGGQFEAFARRGIHVFIEKPINISLKRAGAMVEAAAEGGIVSQVGYHFRFGAAVRELRRRVAAGSAGRPVLFAGSFQCNSLHSPWWRDRSKCGSQILEQVIHTYDIAMHLFGRPSEVTAFMANVGHADVEGYTLEDVSAASVRFACGALGSISATNCAVPMRWDNPFTAVYERLTVRFKGPGEATFVTTEGGTASSEELVDGQDLYKAEDAHFISSVRGGADPACDVGEGYASLAFVDAAMRSARGGGAIVRL